MTTLYTTPPPRKSRATKSRKNRVILAACGTGLLPAAAAFAAPVMSGARDVPLTGTSIAATPGLAGDVIGDFSTTFSIDDGTSPLLAGTLENRVVREASGTLAFHYKLTNTGDTADLGKDLLRFTAFGFSPLLATDVDYLLDAGSRHPTKVTRNNEVIDFRFDGEDGDLAPGESMAFFVRTDAIDFETGGFAIADAPADAEDPDAGAIRSALIDGTFKPVAPVVPLPAAIYSGAIGLATIVAVKRRKWI